MQDYCNVPPIQCSGTPHYHVMCKYDLPDSGLPQSWCFLLWKQLQAFHWRSRYQCRFLPSKTWEGRAELQLWRCNFSRRNLQKAKMLHLKHLSGYGEPWRRNVPWSASWQGQRERLHSSKRFKKCSCTGIMWKLSTMVKKEHFSPCLKQ